MNTAQHAHTQPVFLSLGSNYSFGFAILALKQLIRPQTDALEKVGRVIEQQLGGRPVFYYKGRDAIEQAILAIQRKHRQTLTVFTQAASCYALEEAIVRAGALPVYVDVGRHRLNMTVATIQAAYERAGKPRHSVVIVQHLLGFVANTERIKTWCQEHAVILIEDLAQSYGALTRSGEKVGTLGDIVVISFGRDKILDSVQGGCAVVRNQAVAPQPKRLQNTVPTLQLCKDLAYPMTTWIIRRTYAIGLGKLIFWVSKRLGLLSSPIPAPLPESSSLPLEFGALVAVQHDQLDAQLAHRRQAAQMYWSQLSPWLSALHLTEQDVRHAACLRVPLLVPTVQDFIAFLKRHGVFVSDRWYRAAVDMGDFTFPTVYQQGSCPNAEFLTAHLCNLPTHRSASLAQIERITRIVQSYMQQSSVKQWYLDTLGLETS